jgi:DivIVA domain-containing protein
VGVIAAVLIGVALLTGFAIVLALTDSPMSDEAVDRIDAGLPDRPLTSADIPRLRFRVGLRGYRMDDVDAALQRIQQGLGATNDGAASDALTAASPADPEA